MVENNRLKGEHDSARYHADFETIPIEKIQYIDVAPSQMVGVSAGPDSMALLHLLATCDIPTTEAALGKSITSAQQVSAAIKKTNWQLLENAIKLAGAFTADAEVLKRKVESAVADDEFALLAARVAAHARAVRCLHHAMAAVRGHDETLVRGAEGRVRERAARAQAGSIRWARRSLAGGCE